jgi:hypothetical protein
VPRRERSGLKRRKGRCLSYGSSIPYHPIVDIVRNNCGITETDSPEAIIEKVGIALREVGMDPEQSAPYLLQLLGVRERTEAYLSELVESLPGTSILLLTTYRPGYRPPWIDKSYATQIAFTASAHKTL